jgi:arylsulfatase A-like enzyme
VALYNDGWFLSTKVNRTPWEAFGPANPDPLNNEVLQLFNLNQDFSQTEDLAAKNPQKVRQLKAIHRRGQEVRGLSDVPARPGRHLCVNRRPAFGPHAE